ncbi:unnamed protein product [Medioppia subpectinata]|uniref:F-box domain-containing protein n=1 Tax=Medioppia subpectinata TaxID=1979941 RepID=A0A7R9KQL8_9ACAR|nr:unnamed protein product [Medioppia subpectinata]CAG2107734.1 unnamed protein product [Medioppia subpectinata]
MCEYSKDSFDRFGDDLCEELLSFLTFEDRFRCECLSKQWRRLSQFSDPKDYNEKFYEYIGLYVNLTAIDLPFEKLCKTPLILSADNNAFELFARNYGHNIKSIEFTFDCLIDDNMVNKLSDVLSQMRALIGITLNLNDPFIEWDLLTQIGVKCPQLTSLCVQFKSRTTIEYIDHIMGKHFKQLKRLEINGLYNTTNISNDALIEYSESQVISITDTFFANIDRYLPQLLELRLNDVMITDEVLNALSRLTQIRCIQLMGTNTCHL